MGRICSIPDCSEPHRARGWCQGHYNIWYQNGDPQGRKLVPNFGVCVAPGCEMRPRSRTARYCEMHYGRLRRNGSLDGPNRMASVAIEHELGYLLVYSPGHPLSTRRHAHVYEHRLVFHDAHGMGPHSCHWCGVSVSGSNLHIDHADSNKRNNVLHNLLPSCLVCNMRRGDPDHLKSMAAKSPALTLDGTTKFLCQWAKDIGIKSSSLRLRLKNGWPLARALREGRGKTGPKRHQHHTLKTMQARQQRMQS